MTMAGGPTPNSEQLVPLRNNAYQEVIGLQTGPSEMLGEIEYFGGAAGSLVGLGILIAAVARLRRGSKST